MRNSTYPYLKVGLLLLCITFSNSQSVVTYARSSSECDLKNAAIVFTHSGTNCLDDNGWHEVPSGNPFKESSGGNFDVCTDNSFVFPFFGTGENKTFSVFSGNFDTNEIHDLPTPPEYPWPTKIACSAADDVWFISQQHDNHVLHFKGSQWTVISADEIFGKSAKPITIYDVAVAPASKTLWVTSGNAIASYAGTSWMVFRPGKGLPQTYDLSRAIIKFANDDNPLVATDRGLVKFDGKIFKAFGSGLTAAGTFVPDSKGNVWATKEYVDGIYMFNGKRWIPNPEALLVKAGVDSINVDAQDRVWIATSWGLQVFDGKQWIAYQMMNSDIKDNPTNSVVFFGNGPKLPAVTANKFGSVKGTVIEGGKPSPNVTVELCSNGIPSGGFYGSSPCDGYPDDIKAKTDANGEFLMEKVPVANYRGFGVQHKAHATWTLVAFGALQNLLNTPFVQVRENKILDLGTLNLSGS
jgi:hypothetical protein